MNITAHNAKTNSKNCDLLARPMTMKRVTVATIRPNVSCPALHPSLKVVTAKLQLFQALVMHVLVVALQVAARVISCINRNFTDSIMIRRNAAFGHH